MANRAKLNWCDVAERYSGSWLLRTFLKPSLKMTYIFCEFGCYDRKLCVTLALNKKMTHQQLKQIREYCS